MLSAILHSIPGVAYTVLCCALVLLFSAEASLSEEQEVNRSILVGSHLSLVPTHVLRMLRVLRVLRFLSS